jgi:hypothetical protein
VSLGSWCPLVPFKLALLRRAGAPCVKPCVKALCQSLVSSKLWVNQALAGSSNTAVTPRVWHLHSSLLAHHSNTRAARASLHAQADTQQLPSASTAHGSASARKGETECESGREEELERASERARKKRRKSLLGTILQERVVQGVAACGRRDMQGMPDLDVRDPRRGIAGTARGELGARMLGLVAGSDSCLDLAPRCLSCKSLSACLASSRSHAT